MGTGGGCWVLLLDLDGTVWDNLDISSTRPPYRVQGRGVIVDARGTPVRLVPGIDWFLRWVRDRRGVVVSLSWNIPSIALEALRAMGLEEFFDYHAIAPHPDKGTEARRALEELGKQGLCPGEPCLVVYIDDRDIHWEGVREALGGRVVFLQAWKSFRDYWEAAEKIGVLLAENCGPLREDGSGE